MEKNQWQELCGRIGAVWPGKKLPQGTVDEWYTQFGSWADYDSVGLVIASLGAVKKTAPALSDLREAYAQRGGPPKEPRAQNEPERPEDRERWNDIAAGWIRINRCRYDEGVRSLLLGLIEVDADPLDTKLALIDEIEACGVQEKDAPPVRDVEGFTQIGDALPGAVGV